MPLPWFHATSAAISAQLGSLGPQRRLPRANDKRSLPELIVQVIACLAEGMGIRGTSRVFEIDANTVLNCLLEAAEQLQTFSAPVLHDLRLNQIQLDELYAVLRAVRDGEASEAEAIQASRAPHGCGEAYCAQRQASRGGRGGENGPGT
jgi:hypothetical protein